MTGAPIRVWYADGPGAPRMSPAAAVEAAGLDPERPLEVTLGWTLERPTWLDADPPATVRTLLAGYGIGRAVDDGRVDAPPVRLSAVPSLIAAAPPHVAVIGGIRRGSRLAFARSLGWFDVLAAAADAVVVELADEGDATDLGAPLIPGTIVATMPRPSAPDGASAARAPDEVDLRIGALVASLLPDDPTLQFGPGGIGLGIARAVDRPVRIWSGLVTEPMAALHERGLLRAPAVAAYTWGGRPIDELAAAGMLHLTSTTVTHDITRLSAIPRMIGCNTAVQVGLDGSVNVERVGRRTIAGVGGHSDFCVGASRSPGGLAVVALRSTTTAGASTIVPAVDVVSTPRSDVSVVVTEHGIADLRGIGDAERSRRMTAIAAPEHRDRLASSAT